MELPVIVNLRPSHLLLNPNFDGYKLSLEPVPVIKVDLQSTPRRQYTNDDQYGFLHAKLFSLHNHLFRDPWLAYSSYFIDVNWTIQNVRYDHTIGQLNAIKSVYKISKPNTGRGDYNPSCCFVSEKFCVFADGCGGLKVIDTGDRYRNEEWKSIYSEDSVLTDRVPFVIQDARWEIIDNVRQIHCLLLSVQQQSETDRDQRFEAIIDWIRIRKDTEVNAWSKCHVKQLKGKSLPDYCVLEPKCAGLLLSTDSKFDYSFDSEHPIETENMVAKEIENGSKSTEGHNLTWTQTDEDISVHFNIPRETVKNDIKIICNGTKLKVRHKCEILLDAELYEKIDNDLTTWNLENELLQVTVVKIESNHMWTSLLKSVEIDPVEHPTHAVRDLSHPPTSTLRTEMEECDFGDSDVESEYSLVRMDAVTHDITHRANLGSNNPILFSVPFRAGHPPAFALRSDVDVCLWLPNVQTTATAESLEKMESNLRMKTILTVKHEGTLNAFGYIQASKQQKKFIQCSPDMNYALICEPHRHIFIYKSSYDTASGLKNRNSSTKISIGQQKLITMDESDEVLGIVCENEVCILLTEKHIVCLQINS